MAFWRKAKKPAPEPPEPPRIAGKISTRVSRPQVPMSGQYAWRVVLEGRPLEGGHPWTAYSPVHTIADSMQDAVDKARMLRKDSGMVLREKEINRMFELD